MKTQASSSNTISQKSIKKNTIFNFFLTFANVLFPFITTPYISRVLNIEDIGIINQGSVFSTLFINLISLGVTGYGAREIACVRNDIEKLFNYRFSVPVYQRPYSWTNEEVDSLLLDIWAAYSDYQKLNQDEKQKSSLYVVLQSVRRIFLRLEDCSPTPKKRGINNAKSDRCCS